MIAPASPSISARRSLRLFAQKILDRGGGDLLAVKDNQPSLHDDPAAVLSTHLHPSVRVKPFKRFP